MFMYTWSVRIMAVPKNRSNKYQGNSRQQCVGLMAAIMGWEKSYWIVKKAINTRRIRSWASRVHELLHDPFLDRTRLFSSSSPQILESGESMLQDMWGPHRRRGTHILQVPSMGEKMNGTKESIVGEDVSP